MISEKIVQNQNNNKIIHEIQLTKVKKTFILRMEV